MVPKWLLHYPVHCSLQQSAIQEKGTFVSFLWVSNPQWVYWILWKLSSWCRIKDIHGAPEGTTQLFRIQQCWVPLCSSSATLMPCPLPTSTPSLEHPPATSHTPVTCSSAQSSGHCQPAEHHHGADTSTVSTGTDALQCWTNIVLYGALLVVEYQC